MNDDIMNRPARGQTRRSFVGGGLAVVASTLLAQACGGDDSSDASASTMPPSTSPAPATTLPTTAAPGPDTFTVSHQFGTSIVPAMPQRVVAMENRRDLETAVVLGLPLVGVGAYGGGGREVAAPFVPVDMTGVEVFDVAQINVEQLLVLAPDLILCREIYLGADDIDLGVVAPILPVAGDGSWRDDLLQIAGWLQREATLGSALDQYDALLDEVRARHADRLAREPIAIVEYFAPDATFYAGGLDDFQLQSNTLAELGGNLVPFQTGRSYFDQPFSAESIGEIADASAILLVIDETSRPELDALQLWRNLPAVAAGRVVTTDTRTNQGSVYAATECLRLLDQVFTTLDEKSGG